MLGLEVKFKFSTVRGNAEEREGFWNDLDKVKDRVCNGYRLCVLGDLNGWVGDRVRVVKTGVFGVLGENENGRMVLDFCTEKGLCMGNTIFQAQEFA